MNMTDSSQHSQPVLHDRDILPLEMGVQDGRTGWAYRMGVQDGRTGWVYKMGVQDGHTGWVYRMGVQDGCAGRYNEIMLMYLTR